MNSIEQTSEMMEDPQLQDTEEKPESIRALVESTNLVSKFKKEQLAELAEQVSSGFEHDLVSRKHWEDAAKDWTDLALQVRKEKMFPWAGAANVKYPLLSTAAMQFNARAYPSLVPSDGNVVKTTVVGSDPTGEKKNRADRVSKFMSYQILHEMDGWEEDMDKLLIVLPIVGMAFKKTYFSPTRKKNVSELVLPKNLVVNYWTKNLEEADRISEIILMPQRAVKARQMAGIFDKKAELGDPVAIIPEDESVAARQDETMPYFIIEQHCYYDKDKDGYPEPYVVTFERYSKTILRITARFDEESVIINDEGDLLEIKPIQYYTKYGFIPNPDGSFYDIGFGVLLGPLNESVNTLINQLLDSGHLYNLQAGFLGKGLKMKMGDSAFKPGEWKTLNGAIGDDLKKQILPLPVKEPSKVLFELMGALVTSGKELASVAEIFTGKMPGQNTPATTTMATVEQGMKVFTAVYKRIYRALAAEFKKLYALNRLYAEPQKYQIVLDEEIGQDDFDDQSYDVCPGADPHALSQSERLMKAQGLMELLPTGMLDPVKVISRVLEAQEQPNWQELLKQEIRESGQFEPPPDPKMMEMQMKGQMEQQKLQSKAEMDQQKAQLDAQSKELQMAMQAQEHAQKMQQKAEMAALESAEKQHMQKIFSAEAQAKMIQGLTQKEQQHQQKMQQMKETSKSQQKNSGSRGKPAAARRK
jgi:chaperonin GroES